MRFLDLLDEGREPQGLLRGSMASESSIRRAADLSPDERAADDEFNRSPSNLAMLDRAIADERNPASRTALLEERARLGGSAEPMIAEPKRRAKGGRFSDLLEPLPAAPQSAEKPSGDYLDAIGKGFKDLGVALRAGRWMLSGGNARDIAQAIAEQLNDGSQTAGEREIHGAAKAVNDAQGSWETAKAIGGLLWAAASNPYDTGKFVAQNLPNALPSMGAGAVGAIGGAKAGGLIGGAQGAGIGAVGGGLVGLGAGSGVVEFGARLSEKVGEALAAKKLPATPENVEALLNDPAFRDDARTEGVAKGVTVGAIDALSAVVGGRIATAPFRAATRRVLERSGVDVADSAAVSAALRTAPVQAAVKAEVAATPAARRAGMVAAGVGADSAMEAGGEYAGEAAATGQGKLGDALLEGIASLGQSTAEVLGSRALLTGRGLIAPTVAAQQEDRRRAIEDIARAPDADAAIEAFNRATAPRPTPAEPPIEFDRLGALGLLNAPATPAAPADTGDAIPYDYSQRSQMYPALPSPDMPTGRPVLINDTDPELTRAERYGDREAAVNATQAGREAADRDRDLGITPGTRQAIRARVTLDEEGNILEAPEEHRRFLALTRRDARPHAAAAIDAHAINPGLVEAMLAAPSAGARDEQTVFEAILNGTTDTPAVRSILERHGVAAGLAGGSSGAELNREGAQPGAAAAPGQQPQPGGGAGVGAAAGADAGGADRGARVDPGVSPEGGIVTPPGQIPVENLQNTTPERAPGARAPASGPFQLRGRWPQEFKTGELALLAKNTRSMVERAVARAELDRRNPTRQLDKVSTEARRALWRAVVRAGGIHQDEAADMGIDRRSLPGYRMSGFVTAGGMRADILARFLAENDYLTPEQMADVDGGAEAARQVVADLLAREFVGRSDERDLFNEALSRHHDAGTIEASGVDALPEVDRDDVADYDDSVIPAAAAEFDAALDAEPNMTVADAMRALGFTEAEISDAERSVPEKRGPVAPEAGSDEPGGPEGGGGAGAVAAQRGESQARRESGDREGTAAVVEAPTTEVDTAAHEAATSPQNSLPEPTEEQKKAGNYAKGHVSIAGLDVSIENPAGSKRRPEWPTLQSHYGYFKRTEGNDGDHVDTFIRPGTPTDYDGPVFVVDQIDPKTGRFDEHKVMVGWPDEAAARAAYLENYTADWKGLRAITRMDMDEFKAWLRDGDTTKPAAAASPEPFALSGAAAQRQPTAAGRRRAARAVALFKKAAEDPLRAAELLGGREFAQQFEMGDGDIVSAEVVRALGQDAAFVEALGSPVVQRYVPTWLRAALDAIGKNPEQPATPPVAESQAPGRSADGDRGVAPTRGGGGPESTLNKRHTIAKGEVLTPGGALKAQATASRAPSSIWFYQGDMTQLQFQASVTFEGKPDPRAGQAKALLARIKELKTQGWLRRNLRSGSYGTVWVFEKGNKFLTRAGMENADADVLKRPALPESKAGYESMMARQFELVRAVDAWLNTLPFEQQDNRGVVSRKIGETPVGEWLRIEDQPGGIVIQHLAPDGKWNLQIGVLGDWSDLRRYIAEMAKRADAKSDEYVKAEYDARRAARVKLSQYDQTPIHDAPSAPSAPSSEPVVKPEPQKPATAPSLFQTHFDTMTALNAGTLLVDDYKAAFQRMVDGEADVKAELGKKNKDQLLANLGGFRRPGETKAEVVNAFYEAMLRGYRLGKGYGPNSYTMSAGGLAKFEADKRKALIELVANQTQDDLDAYATEQKKADEAVEAKIAELRKSIEDPKTLGQFRDFIRYHQQQGKTFAEARMLLTPEQRAAFDELTAEDSRKGRKDSRDAQREVRAAGQTTGGEVIATKHTRNGYDLFVVQLADRVSTEDYRTLLASAKTLGGWYSSFRGNGAVPGFQFKDKANAEAFLKLAGGDTEAAQQAAKARRDAFEDDRSQTAVERLNEMADRLEERADEDLSRDRKTNTERRARMAAGAEARAEGDKAMAKTMRNIAAAIEAGTAKFLDRVRQKVQVEFLLATVRTAKNAELRAKYDSYMEQERHKGEPPTIETADFAEFPTYTAYRSDLASLGRRLLEIDGMKQFGQRIMKVADDVSAAYLKFAEEPGNRYKLSTFSIGQGEDRREAVFKNRDDAERAIKRSGLVGKAIVWQEKRGTNRIIMSPSEAMARGIWKGDGDKRITLSREFGDELVGKASRRKGSRDAVPWQFEAAHQRMQLLSRIGIETPAEFRAALREFIGMREAPKTPDKIKVMERAMIGRRADGLDFFPTPESTADEMIAAADIQPGMRVLEPSAGMGHIADRIRGAGFEPDVIEMSGDRRELLEAKGYKLVGSDFMDTQAPSGFTYGDVFRAPDGRQGVLRGLGGMGSDRVRLVDENDGAKVLGYYDRSELEPVRRNRRWTAGNLVSRDDLARLEEMPTVRGDVLSSVRQSLAWFDRGDLEGAALLLDRATRQAEFNPEAREAFEDVADRLAAASEGQYDRIIMNPPFSDGRDIAHVRHAFDLLKPGGRLVAIMGEGAFFNSTKRAHEFRAWLEEVGGTDEKLAEGTFLDSALPVNTGVNARMVVIDKPAASSTANALATGNDDAVFSRGRQPAYMRQDDYRFTQTTDSRGMPAFASTDLVLAHAREVDALGVPAGAKAMAFNIFDRRVKDARGKATFVGKVLVHMDAAGRFVSLRNIVIDKKHRQQGRYLGEGTILGMLRHNDGAPMEVYNIESAARGDENDALPFWRTIGTTILNVSSDPDVAIIGRIALPDYLKAAAKRRRMRGYGTDTAATSRGQPPAARGDAARDGQADAEGSGGGRGVRGRERRPADTGAVARRDATTSPARAGLSVSAIQSEVARLTAGWANAPAVTVLATPADAPFEVPSDANGALLGDDVYLFASNLRNAAAVEFTLFHESLGHYGLRRLFGVDLGAELDRIALNNKNLRIAAERWWAAYGPQEVARLIGKGMEEADARRAVRLLSKEEALADLAGRGERLTGLKRLVAALQDVLRRLGFTRVADWLEGATDAEVGRMLAAAREFVTAGEARVTMADAMWAVYSRLSDQLKGLNRDADKGLFKGGAELDGKVTDVTPDDEIEPRQIIEVHPVRDQKKASDLAGTMADRGWKGRPVLAWDSGNGIFAFTGSHRIAAARKIDILVPVAYVDADAFERQLEADGMTFDELIGSGDDRIEDFFRRAGDARAADMMVDELRQNELSARDDSAQNDLPLFSRGLFDASTADPTPPEETRSRVDALKDSVRGAALGAFTRRQLAEMYGRDAPEVAAYDRLAAAMDAERANLSQEADRVLQAWRRLGRDTADKMADIMHEATLAQFDPDTGTRGEGFGLSTALTNALADRFAALPASAKAVYRQARDMYGRRLEALFEALAARIQRSGADPDAARRTVDQLRQQYDRHLRNGPYFPLARFGDYLLIANRREATGADDDRVVMTFESAAERDRQATLMKAKGYRVKTTVAKEYSRTRDGSAGPLAEAMTEAIEALEMDHLDLQGADGTSLGDLKGQLLDELNQALIRGLPELSYRKHFVHRKGTPGFSRDAMRAFADSQLHAANHIARMEYGDRLARELDRLQERVTETGDGDVTVLQQVANEMVKRHELALNHVTHPAAAMLGQLGFFMSLGASVASGVVNLTQTPLVTYPWLAARHGWGKTSLALSKAARDYAASPWEWESGMNAAKNAKLAADETAMLRGLEDRGLINTTLAHDLAGASSTDNLNQFSKYGSAWQRVMRFAGWSFHVPEVANRQITALAAYRLARAGGKTAEAATEAAAQAITATHFDYSTGNRARYFEGNFRRVILMFKQYSQNIAYLYGRAAYQAFRGATAAEKREARRLLAGMLGVQFAAAGALGLPFVGSVAAVIAAAMNGFADDDEEFDWQVEFRKWMASTVGKDMGEALSHGLPRLVLGWDVAGRIGQSDLFVRGPNREQEGRDAYLAWMQALAGPVAGYALNGYLGMSDLAKGAGSLNGGLMMRGVEEMMPAAVRNALKAMRYEAEDGLRTRAGQKQIELDAFEKVGQAMGFTPTRVSEFYEGMTAVKNRERRIDTRRADLLDRYAEAVRERDAAGLERVRADIVEFNGRNPAVAIRGDTLLRSMQNRRRREGAPDGIYLPRNREFLRQEGAFANL